MKLISQPASKPVDPVLRPSVVFLWAVVALGITIGLTAFLAQLSYRADPQRLGGLLDVVRIGLSVGVGTGGLFALWLATRRQRSAEQTLKLQREVSEITVIDSTERRITDQYSKAIEQLGHEKAAVRLGAIYSLERLAQEHAGHRQTVVDVFCSYLRLPFEPPADRGKRARPAAPDNVEGRAELEVRRTIQSMLWAHLGDPDQRAVGSKRWPNIDLDLSRTKLVDPILRMLAVRSLKCEDMVVHGIADFSRLRVAEHAAVGGARFHGQATFADSVFSDGFALISCVFESKLDLSGVRAERLFAVTTCHFRGEVDLSNCVMPNLGFFKSRFDRDLVLRSGDCTVVMIMENDFQGTVVNDALEVSTGLVTNCSFRRLPDRHPKIVVFDDFQDTDSNLRDLAAHFGYDPTAPNGDISDE
ncbi:hypothetical protein FXN61_33030 [Lentzea sp. PSKA42]|uniref:Pentapeptide repeat-containing protein n=1 Tax=Lentzea indica TaxID=2604800 RepID=A0ABX1FS59_9PSEU|nr:hypothetical protein [Lentzea indica]NKE61333.1 hypothetical protein [Lentzea indica]